MIFNYTKILKVLLVGMIAFILINYTAIPLLGVGSTILEGMGFIILILSILLSIDLIFKIIKK